MVGILRGADIHVSYRRSRFGAYFRALSPVLHAHAEAKLGAGT